MGNSRAEVRMLKWMNEHALKDKIKIEETIKRVTGTKVENKR